MKDFWKREIVEMIAPVTWAASPKKLFVEVKRIAWFAFAAFSTYLFLEFLVAGIYKAWGTAFIVVAGLLFVPAAIVGWLNICISSGKYNEYK